MHPPFVLVHSPLVGPTTWSLVAGSLRAMGIQVTVPCLPGADRAEPPYREAQVSAVAAAADALPAGPVVLVGHSGAGPLLPAIAGRAARRVAAYVFLDAIVPDGHGLSWLDLFDSPQTAEEVRAAAVGGSVPNLWSNEAVWSAVGIEDAALARRCAAEAHAIPLAMYEEPIPVPAGWPDAPCAYLAFRQSRRYYQRSIDRARAREWPFRELAGAHFQMLVDPPAVTRALLDLTREMGV